MQQLKIFRGNPIISTAKRYVMIEWAFYDSTEYIWLLLLPQAGP